jgi:hypothetical protein
MTWLDDVAFHHLLVLRVFTSKLIMCCSYVPCLLAHLMPPCGLYATPLEKKLRNGLPLIWLKPPKLIVSFTTRVMVKMAPETRIICKRYQFLRFYLKWIPKRGKLVFELPKSQSPKVVAGPLLRKICQDKFDDIRIAKIWARMWKM